MNQALYQYMDGSIGKGVSSKLDNTCKEIKYLRYWCKWLPPKWWKKSKLVICYIPHSTRQRFISHSMVYTWVICWALVIVPDYSMLFSSFYCGPGMAVESGWLTPPKWMHFSPDYGKPSLQWFSGLFCLNL